MDKQMRLWIIGIGMALVIIVVAAAAAANRGGSRGNEPGNTSESYVTQNDATVPETNGRSVQPQSMSDSHMDHSFHGSQGTVTGEELNRYLTEQDSIMMNMMEDMIIREKSGNASIDFLEGMIPHHEAAIKMSESYLNYSKDGTDLQTLAQDIITEHKKELAQMNELIQKYRNQSKKDRAREDGYLAKYSQMFSQDSRSHHVNPSGAQTIDRAFAESMIIHHQMAVDMAGDILDYTDEKEVRQLAREIKDVQEKEIRQMQGMSGISSSAGK